MFKKHPYLYEIPLLYLLLFGFNLLLLPQYYGFVGVDPHPYWFCILLFGFRYGVIAGLMSGLAACMLYMAFAWHYVERYLFEDMTFYLLPGAFVLVGALVGVGVQRYRQRLDRLVEEKEILLKNEKGLKEESRALQEINQGLEKRIVTRMSTMVTLYEGARRLESVQPEELYRAVLEFVAKTLEADQAALYLKADGGWQLREKLGWKDYEKRPETLKAEEGITGMAGSAGRIISIRDFLGKEENNGFKPRVLGDCLVAGPLKRGESGEVVGVLSIQSMPFLNFNSATVNLFGFLLNWASRALDRAFFVQELRSQEILDPEYQLYSWRYFYSRGAQEFLRSKTYYLPLSVGLVKLEGLLEMPSVKRTRLLTAVGQLLKECCRDMDIVARGGRADIPFAILWITASPAQAIAGRAKILEQFAGLKLPARLSISISSFEPKTPDFNSLLQEAQKGL